MLRASASSVGRACAMAGLLALAGCHGAPYYRTGYPPVVHRSPVDDCATCGTVRSVQTLAMSGDLRAMRGIPAADIGPAPAASQAPDAARGDPSVWQVVIERDDKLYATVTQREDPQVHEGERVEVRGGRVFLR